MKHEEAKSMSPEEAREFMEKAINGAESTKPCPEGGKSCPAPQALSAAWVAAQLEDFSVLNRAEAACLRDEASDSAAAVRGLAAAIRSGYDGVQVDAGVAFGLFATALGMKDDDLPTVVFA